jgi:hypothetical protein
MRQATTTVAPLRIELTRRLLLTGAIAGVRFRRSRVAVVCTSGPPLMTDPRVDRMLRG